MSTDSYVTDDADDANAAKASSEGGEAAPAPSDDDLSERRRFWVNVVARACDRTLHRGLLRTAGRLSGEAFDVVKLIYLAAAWKVTGRDGVVIRCRTSDVSELLKDCRERESGKRPDVIPTGTLGAMTSRWNACFAFAPDGISSPPISTPEGSYVVVFHHLGGDKSKHLFWVDILTAEGTRVVETVPTPQNEVLIGTSIEEILVDELLRRPAALELLRRRIANSPPLGKLLLGLLTLLLLGACAYAAHWIYLFIRMRPAPGTSNGVLPENMRPLDAPTDVKNGIEFRRRGLKSILLTSTERHNDAWDGRRAEGIRFQWKITEHPSDGGAPKVTRLESAYPQVLYTSPFAAISGTLEVQIAHTHVLTARYETTNRSRVHVDWSDQFLPSPTHETSRVTFIENATDRSLRSQVIITPSSDVGFVALVIAIPIGWDSRQWQGEIRIPDTRGNVGHITTKPDHFALTDVAVFPTSGTYPILARVSSSSPFLPTGASVLVAPDGTVALACTCAVGTSKDSSSAWADLAMPTKTPGTTVASGRLRHGSLRPTP